MSLHNSYATAKECGGVCVPLIPSTCCVQVSVRSTDVDRTLMSAETQLSALFPPEGDQVMSYFLYTVRSNDVSFPQKFNAELPWQPIPVHTVPKDQDPVRSIHCRCQVSLMAN